MRMRRGLVAGFAAVAMLMVAGSAAWACVSATGAYMGDVTPNRVPVLTATQVTGGGWQSSAPVDLGWAASPTAPVQHLATANTDSSGTLTATVTVPNTQAGYYYLIATQGSTTKAMPFEVTANAASPVSSPVATPATPAQAASGQDWNGLRADNARARGLADLPPAQHHSPALPALGLVAAATVALGALGLVEARRRRVTVHAEIR